METEEKKASQFINKEFANAFRIGDFCHAAKLARAGANLYEAMVGESDALTFAMTNANINYLQELINMGYDINRRDSRGASPIYKSIEMIAGLPFKLLLNLITDIDARYDDMGGLYDSGWLHHKTDNKTLLMVSCHIGYVAQVKNILSKKADPNAVDSNGFTPLMYLATRKYIPKIKTPFDLLLNENGELVFEEEVFGIEEERLIKIAKALIKRGADIRKKNKAGLMAHQLTPSVMLKSYLKSLLETQASVAV
ncbi:MAG: hypothetical protein WCJ94_07225 [bacterium]